jgi:ferric-dicitrate binding protein FerR (iron transport regulator)
VDAGRVLLHRYLDETASPGDLAELARRLVGRPDLADDLAAACRTEALLESHFQQRRTVSAVTAELACSPPPLSASGSRHAFDGKWCAAALVLLALGAAFGFWLGRGRERPGEVVSGRVVIDGVAVERVPAGSRLEVEGEAPAVILLPDGSHAELQPSSSAVLHKRSRGSRKTLELDRGTGTFHVEKSKRRFRVYTPVGSVSALDAEFRVELQPDLEEGEDPLDERAVLMVVAALVGQVEVESGGRQYRLAAGQKKSFQDTGSNKAHKPNLGGVVVETSPGRLTVESPPARKGGQAIRKEINLSGQTEIVYSGVPQKARKPTVGYLARVWLKEGSRDVAAKVQFLVKQVILDGVVASVAEDGKSFTLETPGKKGKPPVRTGLKIAGAKLVYRDAEKGDKPTAGYFARVWLKAGTKDTAGGVVFSSRRIDKKGQPGKKPLPQNKPKPEGNDRKPEKKKEPRAGGPARDPAPTAAFIDAEVDRELAARKVPASPPADDAEFLRRVSLDLTGRIPTYRRTVSFLQSKAPDKRRRLVDELLEGEAYGRHFATVWSNLLAPDTGGLKGKGNNTFAPWLAEQFNDNRGWNAVVADLLTAQGPISSTPQGAFLLANAENFQPKPNRVAGSFARLFWGVNLGCAECHKHPFADWKQADFWGTAAFFARLRFTGFKGGTAALTEDPSVPAAAGKKKQKKPAPALSGAAIRVPSEAGKLAGAVVKAKFLRGETPALDEKGPFRPRFASWATGAEHPYFARASANRLWDHFFGRGLVNPLDGLDANEPSHPALLRRLAAEFAASGFDLKHLARCITTSNAYQRTSRPLPGNAADAGAFSHMALKVLTPEALYDSVAVVLAADKDSPYKTSFKGNKGGGVEASREQFARFFRPGDAADPSDYTQGVPQVLRLLNGPLLNRGAPVIDKLCASEHRPEEAVLELYLTALSRKPKPGEVKLFLDYLSRRKDAREGYAGVLWILLNSSEFAINR